jgi:hypothetical protein
MPHLTETNIHRYLGDPLLLLIPVDNLDANDTIDAVWLCEGVVGVRKELLAGVTVVTGAQAQTTYPGTPELADVTAAQAVLVVDVDAVDVELDLGIGRWRWQAIAGGVESQVVAYGALVVTRRVPEPVGT